MTYSATIKYGCCIYGSGSFDSIDKATDNLVGMRTYLTNNAHEIHDAYIEEHCDTCNGSGQVLGPRKRTVRQAYKVLPYL